ncbi:MAG: PQQ-binding-like beta-propeller repeat protein [Pirellulaceae bacterium]
MRILSQKWTVWLASVAVALLVGSTGHGQPRSSKSKAKAAARANAAAAEAERGEWSRWRGPRGDGISLETGLLGEWPEEGPPLAWRTKGLGSGYASVSIAGGTIYTLGKQGDKTFLSARSVADGSELWRTAVGGGGNPNCTPTVDGDRVYGLTHGGDLFCCRTEDGALVWSKNYHRDFGAEETPGWGFSESPLVDGDRLICTPGSDRAMLAALDKRTGETIWTTQAAGDRLGKRGHEGAGYSSIVIGKAGGVKQYVTLVGKGVIGVEAAGGKLLWSYNAVANGTACIPTPIVEGDYVFCSSGYGAGSALLKLQRSAGGFEAEEVYFLAGKQMQNHHGGMIHKDGFLYCGHGHNEGFPLCIDVKTGRDAWRPGRGPGSGSAAVAYADGRLYFRYQDGTMALIEATPKQYNLKGKFKIASKNGESWPHPVIAGGKLYLRDQDELLCYDVKEKP